MKYERILSLASEKGFSAAIISTDRINFDVGFRVYCEENLCGNFGVNYSCPPDCGKPEEMIARILNYPRALVVQSKWDITDWKDKAAIRQAKSSHNASMMQMIQVLQKEGLDGIMGGASNCMLCEKCAAVDGEPCCYPGLRYSCLSAYCIHVRDLAEKCGLDYACEDGKLSLFGIYAFTEKKNG